MTTQEPKDLHLLERECGWTILACLAGVGLLWIVFVHTAAGQELDNAILISRTADPVDVVLAHLDTLELITVTSVAVGCVGLVLVGVFRGRFLLGLSAAMSVGLASLTSEALKRIIERPELADTTYAISPNSFPSGHVTIATSLALGFILVTPHRWRTPTAIGGALWTIWQSTAVVAAGWHRPSDAAAGTLVALAWAAVAVLVLARLHHIAESAARFGRVERSSRWVAAVLLVVAATLTGSLLLGGTWPIRSAGPLFLASCMVVGVFGTVVVWWFVRLLRGWSAGQEVVGRDSAAIVL